ncbi:MAG: STAS domain-containing protein [Nitrospirae bacterium]|nr:STAS domain-containing protein [Nitrospirota bacterium]
MDTEIVKEATGTVLKLGGELSIADAAVFRDVLVTALDGEGHVVVDASLVERFDTSGIQLLLAARSACERRHRGFAVRGLSPSCVAMWRLLGCSEDVISQSEESAAS